jgi:hypothetical protein
MRELTDPGEARGRVLNMDLLANAIKMIGMFGKGGSRAADSVVL